MKSIFKASLKGSGQNNQAILFLLLIFSTVQLYAQETVSVTITNQNLGLVKEQRILDLKKGAQQIHLEDIPAQINPASVLVEGSFDILEQNFAYDLFSVDKLLQKSLAKEIIIEHPQQGRIEGVLLSANSIHLVIKNPDGIIQIVPLNNEQKISLKQSDSELGKLLIKPALVWKVQSAKNGSHEAKISYLTGGLNWNVDYTGLLSDNDENISVSAWVTIANTSGKSFPAARLKLMAGNLNRVSPTRQPSRQMESFALAKSAPAFDEKPFFEYHIYDLAYTTELENNQTKQIRLFDRTTARTAKIYRIDSFNPEKVAVIISILNSGNNNLGIPLPEGIMRIFKKDGDDREFVGESAIGHTAKNEKLDIEVGSAFDIVSERSVVQVKRPDNRSERRTVEYKIRNRKEDKITLEIAEHLPGNSEVLVHSANGEPVIKKSGLLKYEVTINAGQEYIFNLEYTVRW